MYYHVWFLTKYRRPVLKGGLDRFIKETLCECIKKHKYNALELETNMDHVHILLEVENKQELSNVMRAIKAVSSKEVCSDAQFCFGHYNAFWARRYGYKEIKENEIGYIREYIRNQRNEDGN